MTAADVLTMIVALYAHHGSVPPKTAPMFARVIAAEVQQEPDRLQLAGWLVVTAKEEGNFCHGYCRRGDRGRSACTFQIMSTHEKRRRLLERSPAACVRAGIAALKASALVCPENPLAQYAGGCRRPAAQRISARRVEDAIFLTLPE